MRVHEQPLSVVEDIVQTANASFVVNTCGVHFRPIDLEVLKAIHRLTKVDGAVVRPIQMLQTRIYRSYERVTKKKMTSDKNDTYKGLGEFCD